MNITNDAIFITAEGNAEVLLSETAERNFIKLRITNGNQWAIAVLSYEAVEALKHSLYTLDVQRVVALPPEEKSEDF